MLSITYGKKERKKERKKVRLRFHNIYICIFTIISSYLLRTGPNNSQWVVCALLQISRKFYGEIR